VKNIIVILSSVLLNASAQLSMRKGMLEVGQISSLDSFIHALPVMLTSLFLWLAIVCYGVSVILWMVVLSKVEVSFAYPFLSIGYVVSAVVGYLFMHEAVTPTRIAGIIVICVGVCLIARS
jgi:drug/metabolite transporter (DMT)-like permease